MNLHEKKGIRKKHTDKLRLKTKKLKRDNKTLDAVYKQSSEALDKLRNDYCQ